LGLLDIIMQHVAAMLWHRVFCDALLAKSSKQMLQKFLDFEDRAIAVFCQDALLLLGNGSPRHSRMGVTVWFPGHAKPRYLSQLYPSLGGVQGSRGSKSGTLVVLSHSESGASWYPVT